MQCKREFICKGDPGPIPESERSPGEGKATHSSMLAWEILWRQQDGRLQSMGSQRVRHDLVTNPPPHFLDTDYGLLPASGSGNTKSLTLEGSYGLKEEKGLCLDVANMVLNVL